MTATPKQEIFLVAVEAALEAYRDGDAVPLLSAGTLGALAYFEANDEPWYLGVLSQLDPGTAREVRRKVWELRRQAETEPRAEPDDDWPGSGEVGHLLRTEPPPVQWFARERLLAGRAHILTGIGGSSKTRMLYHLGVGSVLGRLPWAWEIERTGSAALFLSEDTQEGVHRTLAAMARAMRLSEREIDILEKRLRVFGLAGKSSHLLLAKPGGALVESWRVDRILETLRTLPPPLAFVGLDPALGLTEGDEMNPAHQRRLGEMADRIAIELCTCVVLNTHAAKAVQTLDELGSHTSRGSGAITDAVRGEFALRTMTAAEAKRFGISDPEERKALVQLAAVKGNELPPAAFVPVWLRRGAGGVLEPAEMVEREVPAVGKRETSALEILRKMVKTAVPQLREWREACIAEGLVTGPTDRAREKAMERIRDALLVAGMIERGFSRGVYVPAEEVQ